MIDEQEMAEQQNHDTQRPRIKKRKFNPFAVIFLIAIAIFLYWLSTMGRVSTDDAQVNGDVVPISSRVSGYVKNIYVDDNDQVQQGRVLVQLDRRDLAAKLQTQQADLATQRAQAVAAAGQESLIGKTAPAGAEQAGAAVSVAQSNVNAAQKGIVTAQEQANSAQAAVEAAQAAVAGAQADAQSAAAQVTAAQAAVRAAQADVGSSQAQAQRTAADAARFRTLTQRGAASQQQLESAEAANTSAQENVTAARERVAGAQASLDQARARQSSATSAVGQAKARLASAKAAAAQARNGVSVARTAYATAQAQVAQAQAAQSGATTAPQQLSVAQAQRRAALAKAAQSEANLGNAELQLSYTTITAPVDGVVSQKSVQLGQFVQPGQQLMSLVPLRNVWVTANFKETDTTHMRPGQKAIVEVDTYPGRKFEGKVQSIGAATGAKFSLLPPENATGNFVKVVQRIPVKIVFTPLPKGVVLRPGYSVTATVYIGGK